MMRHPCIASAACPACVKSHQLPACSGAGAEQCSGMAVLISPPHLSFLVALPCHMPGVSQCSIATVQRQYGCGWSYDALLCAVCPQVPALKQHYDRVLSDLQKERDTLMADRASIMQVWANVYTTIRSDMHAGIRILCTALCPVDDALCSMLQACCASRLYNREPCVCVCVCVCVWTQKLQHIQAASEEERRRLESAYKEKLAAMDEKLRTLRHKEREFVSMQKLKQRTEVSEGCSFGLTRGLILQHVVLTEGIFPQDKRVDRMQNMEDLHVCGNHLCVYWSAVASCVSVCVLCVCSGSVQASEC